ncbi:MAG: hypothetical protein AAGL69_06005 [Pseudomonadota bacterium]
MKCRSVFAILVIAVPSVAYACGGGDRNYVGLAVLLALLIAMTSAFLIPLAGIFAVSSRRPWATARLFGVYGATAATSVWTIIFRHPSNFVSAMLILVCAVLLVAPSLHYFRAALNTTRVSRPDRTGLDQAEAVRS